MNYLPEFATVALIHLLAVMSPGPDFVMVVRNAFKYSTKTAVWSAIGLGLGIALHVLYSIVGIGILVSKSVIAFSIIKFLGAGYLIYIGWKSLRTVSKTNNHELEIKKTVDISVFEALKLGFLTNALNPKATVFIVSLFSQFISSSTPLTIKILYGLEMSTVTMLWFTLVGIIVAHRSIKSRLIHSQTIIERISGAVLILFGLKLAFSKK